MAPNELETKDNQIDLVIKQKELETLVANKIQELQNIENMRNQLTTEIVKLQGKLEMLKEINNSEKSKQTKQEEPTK